MGCLALCNLGYTLNCMGLSPGMEDQNQRKSNKLMQNCNMKNTYFSTCTSIFKEILSALYFQTLVRRKKSCLY